MESRFDFRENYAAGEINKRKSQRVLLQFPEGLKPEAPRLAEYFEGNTNAEIIVSGEPCWGACDLALNEAKDIGADLIIHYGHAPFIKKVDFPVLYIEMHDKTPIFELLQKVYKNLDKYNKIGLVCSIQHMHQLEETKNFLENKGKKVLIPKKKGYSYYDGHVVGCEYNSLKSISNEIDAFLVIGNRFHSLGAALSVKKPVYLLDIYNNEISDMEKTKEKIVKQRFAAIEKAKEADKIGIIIGTKPGQRFGSFKIIREKFRKVGKEVVLLTMNEITEDKLTNFPDLKVFVELACPRIAVEDFGRYNKTLITFREAMVVLGDIKWEDLLEGGLL